MIISMFVLLLISEVVVACAIKKEKEKSSFVDITNAYFLSYRVSHLFNPAIFTGKVVKCTDMALEYLEVCKGLGEEPH